MARECYQAVLASKENHAWMVDEESKKPTQELEDVSLVEGDVTKVIRVGPGIDSNLKTKIMELLNHNLDIFAWTHKDMSGIDNKVIEHRLNVDLTRKPVQQKRRVFAPERNRAIVEEIEKLLATGFIREVYYPEWLVNVVMVKKSNEKWRMCVDFTDLNHACPKDSFPLPKID